MSDTMPDTHVHTYERHINVESIGYTLCIQHDGTNARIITLPQTMSSHGRVVIDRTTLEHAVQHVASMVALDMAIELDAKGGWELWCTCVEPSMR